MNQQKLTISKLFEKLNPTTKTNYLVEMYSIYYFTVRHYISAEVLKEKYPIISRILVLYKNIELEGYVIVPTPYEIQNAFEGDMNLFINFCENIYGFVDEYENLRWSLCKVSKLYGNGINGELRELNEL